jgi:hypothetical protein
VIRGESRSATSDVRSLGLSLMEGGQNRSPFPHEPPLSPLELLEYIVNYPPELLDEPDRGVRWSGSFKHFLKVWYSLSDFGSIVSLVWRRTVIDAIIERPSMGYRDGSIEADMQRWIREVWEWPP